MYYNILWLIHAVCNITISNSIFMTTKAIYLKCCCYGKFIQAFYDLLLGGFQQSFNVFHVTLRINMFAMEMFIMFQYICYIISAFVDENENLRWQMILILNFSLKITFLIFKELVSILILNFLKTKCLMCIQSTSLLWWKSKWMLCIHNSWCIVIPYPTDIME